MKRFFGGLLLGLIALTNSFAIGARGGIILTRNLGDGMVRRIIFNVSSRLSSVPIVNVSYVNALNPERMLVSGHLCALSYNKKGKVYRIRSGNAEASKNWMKTMEIKEEKLNLNYPDTAQSYFRIAVNYHSQDDYAKALEYYGKALDILERKLGPDHPYTKTVREIIVKCREECRTEFWPFP